MSMKSDQVLIKSKECDSTRLVEQVRKADESVNVVHVQQEDSRNERHSLNLESNSKSTVIIRFGKK